MILHCISLLYFNNLHIYQYNFISNPNNDLSFGVIAQELQKVCPSLVSTNENGLLSVDYIGLFTLSLVILKDLMENNVDQNKSNKIYLEKA